MTVGVAVTIVSREDAHTAYFEARRIAAAVGFDRVAAEEVALATSELATNLARYTAGGKIELSATRDGDRIGMQIDSRDHGPGIADVGGAMRDGFSTGGGLGGGLPAARRLLDDLEVASDPAGTHIRGRKWLRRK